MPVKIFSVPGDHRDDFAVLESQMNDWIAESQPKIINMHCVTNTLPQKRDVGLFVLTVLVHYE